MNPYAQGHAIPGMEFFQSMLKGAGLPAGFASWMAPTMDPQELEQKITELKAVLQWLEANARLTQATIQALEVQRMTLAALKSMNVDLGDLAGRMAEAMQAGAQDMAASSAAERVASPEADAGEAPSPAPDAETEAEAASGPASPLPGMMDPMQWWNAVSQQFSQVATQALRESPWPMPESTDVGAGAAQQAGTPRPARTAAHKTAAKPAAAPKPAGKTARRKAPGSASGAKGSKPARVQK
ncbi:hypothetical protein GALL_289330 [mine drainage metagenome]|uniref:Alginate regulatory protein AlgP n=1 Tax=mine drainage metagenome TaxID=410659 RepID=A0A1J5QZY1_9ZZZZ